MVYDQNDCNGLPAAPLIVGGRLVQFFPAFQQSITWNTKHGIVCVDTS